MSEPVQAAGGDHTIKITVAFLIERIAGRGLAQGGKLNGTLTKEDRQHTGASGRQSNARRCRPFGMKARTVAAVPTGSPAYGLPPIRSISSSRCPIGHRVGAGADDRPPALAKPPGGRPAIGGSALPSGYACQEAAHPRGHRDRPPCPARRAGPRR
jgi:hypothetical protein